MDRNGFGFHCLVYVWDAAITMNYTDYCSVHSRHGNLSYRLFTHNVSSCPQPELHLIIMSCQWVVTVIAAAPALDESNKVRAKRLAEYHILAFDNVADVPKSRRRYRSSRSRGVALASDVVS